MCPGAALVFITRLLDASAATGSSRRVASAGLPAAADLARGCAPGSERAPPAGSCGRASHAASGQQPWHLPGRPHWGSAGPPPRPARPCAPLPTPDLTDLALIFFLPSCSLTSHSFSLSLFLYLLFFSPKAGRRRSKWEEICPSPPTLPLPGGGDRGYCCPCPPPLPPPPIPSPPSFFQCNALAACWSPKPAPLLSMPSGPAGSSLLSACGLGCVLCLAEARGKAAQGDPGYFLDGITRGRAQNPREECPPTQRGLMCSLYLRLVVQGLMLISFLFHMKVEMGFLQLLRRV